MGNLLGAAIGALIDRRDGDSGIKGALVGSVSQRLLSAAIPIVTLIAIGWAIEHYLSASSGKPADADD